MKDAKSALNGVQNVVFDLDGTFYHKNGLPRRMVRRLWWSLPLMAIDRCSHGRLWRWIVGSKWHKQTYLPTMVELIRTTCPQRQETLALLAECKAKGLKTAVYSDYGAVAEKLTALGIEPKQFDLIITAPELGGLKPTEACVKRVMELLGATPENTLFVGDRDEKDGACARAVGAKFLLVNSPL